MHIENINLALHILWRTQQNITNIYSTDDLLSNAMKERKKNAPGQASSVWRP